MSSIIKAPGKPNGDNFNMNMKPFSLEEYLKNPNRKIVTRDGRAVRIICIDKKSNAWPIVALATKKEREIEDMYCYSKYGKHYLDKDNCVDLFFAPEKKEGWINIYKYNLSSLITPGSQVYNTKEEAESAIGSGLVDYISTIKIQWEE